MDAPISITLAHLIIIWTLTLLLIAWMLVSAVLAIRSNHHSTTHQDATETRSDGSMSNIHTPRASVAPQFLIYQTTPIVTNTSHHEATTITDEVPATPIR